MLFFLLLLTIIILILCFTIVSKTQSSLAEFFFVIMLWCMDLNASSMSDNYQLVYHINWRFYDHFFLYYKTNVNWILDFFNSLDIVFKLNYRFSVNQLQSRIEKIQNLDNDIKHYQNNLIASSQHIFQLHQAIHIRQFSNFSKILFLIQFRIQFFICRFEIFTKSCDCKIFHFIIS